MAGIKAHIIGKNNQHLDIDEEGAAAVVVHPHPPLDEEIDSLPYRAYFTNDSVSPTNDMAQNGGTTSLDFSVDANSHYNIYIKYISVEIGDGGSPNLNGFGALSALTNGVEWIWFTQKEGEYPLHEGIKTNKEFIRVGTDTAAIGSGTDAFLADVSGGGSEKSYFPSIDISESYGLPWGLKLKKGTTDKIIFRVNDNLSNLTTFNIVAYGIRI
jgi:hypothetical protein